MCDEREQERQDLYEFLQMLDFRRIGDKEIEIVENQFTIAELPASIQNYLQGYFDYLDSIR